ncbi:MAG TPA: hypothetical protein VK957_14810 [Lunatimonas sp.]|nr:hypothetical protein [Lunatimonas sp.]
MKRLFSITLFFWAFTYTQETQHIPCESCMDKKTIWPEKLLASGQKTDLITPDAFYPLEFEARNECHYIAI